MAATTSAIGVSRSGRRRCGARCGAPSTCHSGSISARSPAPRRSGSCAISPSRRSAPDRPSPTAPSAFRPRARAPAPTRPHLGKAARDDRRRAESPSPAPMAAPAAMATRSSARRPVPRRRHRSSGRAAARRRQRLLQRAPRRSSSAQASVSAVGSPAAMSTAKLGPVSCATRAPGAVRADQRRGAEPGVHVDALGAGDEARRARRTVLKHRAIDCVGTAISAISASIRRIGVTRTLSGRRTPGRRGDLAGRGDPSAPARAQSVTRRPAAA
jgi:hypothetical protein